jgi:4-hydroxy 2-oxovalerate aldolase
MSAPWVTYRPEIKVLDCTIRDGGLVNDHMFDDGLVKAVYEACIEAGIDYMEVGYKASKKLFAPSKFGAWKYCDEDDVRRIVGENDSPLKLAAMTDAEKTDYHTDVLPKEQSDRLPHGRPPQGAEPARPDPRRHVRASDPGRRRHDQRRP